MKAAAGTKPYFKSHRNDSLARQAATDMKVNQIISAYHIFSQSEIFWFLESLGKQMKNLGNMHTFEMIFCETGNLKSECQVIYFCFDIAGQQHICKKFCKYVCIVILHFFK